MLTLLAKLLAALNSESSPRQIALALALAMIVGFTPFLSLHNLLILLLAFVIKVNLSAFFVGLTLFSALGMLAGGFFAGIGEQILHAQGLESLWTALYQFTWFKLAHFHHTLTLGGLAVAVALFAPVMLLGQWLILRYRVHFKTFIEKFKIVQTLKGSRFYQAYQSFAGGV